MSKHTKGPWGIRITETGPWSVFNADGNWIAVTTRKQWKDEDKANARLIAAAPDLLEALEYMVNVCPAIDPDGEEAHNRAADAIAKAKGEV